MAKNQAGPALRNRYAGKRSLPPFNRPSHLHVVRSLLVLLICLADSVLGAYAVAGQAAVTYHEPLRQLRYLSAQGQMKLNAGERSDAVQRMQFSAFGRVFDWQLAPNHALVPARTRNGDSDEVVQLLRGQPAEDPHGWVRVAIVGHQVYGMARVHGELYAIEPAQDLAPYTDVSDAADADASRIFRVADTLFDHADRVLHPPLDNEQSIAPARPAPGLPLAGKSHPTRQAAGGPRKRIQIGLLADAAYSARYGTLSVLTQQLLIRANQVDGIFAEQLGVQIEVVEVIGFEADPGAPADPFSQNDAEQLLDEVARYKSTSAMSSLGLVHLFSGRDLNANTVGIAYLSTICSTRNSVSLTQASGSATRDALIAAHEIGHNFGAPHDGEAGSACASTGNGFLMQPAVNGSEVFSDCSLQAMQSLANNGLCLLPAVQTQFALSASLPEVLVLGEPTDLEIAATVSAASGVSQFHLDVDIGPAVSVLSAVLVGGSCVPQGQQIRCTHPGMLSGHRAVLQLQLLAQELGAASVQAHVYAPDDLSVFEDRLNTDLTVAAGVDLLVSVDQALVPVRPGEQIRLRFDVANALSQAAHGVKLHIDTDDTTRLALASDDPACQMAGNILSCALGTLTGEQVGGVEITVAAASDALTDLDQLIRSIRATVSGDLPNLNPANELATAAVAVVGAIVDLSATLQTAPNTVQEDQTATFDLMLSNLGPDNAQDVLLSVTLSSSAAALQSVRSSKGECELLSQVDMVCEIANVGSGESVQLSVDARGQSANDVTLGVATSNAAFDLQASNDSLSTGFAVKATAPGGTLGASTSAGGGGGLTSPAWLLGLIALIRARRWRHACRRTVVLAAMMRRTA